MNKLDELKSQIEIEQPDLIAITETKPKHTRFSITTPELSLANYQMLHTPIDEEGRGCAIYVRSNIKCNLLSPHSN